LRTCVEKNLEFSSEQFLPRVPKEKREIYTQLNFLRKDILRNISIFPYFLEEWLQFKKAYILYGSGVIPIVAPEEKNFLPHSPYDSFIIKFSQPMPLVIDNNLSKDCNMIMVVVNRIEGMVDILPITSDLKEVLLSEKEKLLLKNREHTLKIKNLKELKFWGMTIDLHTGAQVADIEFEPIGENEYEEVVCYLDYKGNEHFKKLYSTIIGTVNGFCKLVSELVSQKYTLELANNKGQATPKMPEEYDWNAIPITQIKNLGSSGYEMHISFSIKRGTEKCPHWRKGHWRRIVHSDGVSERIWIEQTLVREDKLKTEDLKGSATLIKDVEE
jgi:hypothetical protein